MDRTDFDALDRISRLEREVSEVKGSVVEIRTTLMGDMKEPGGVLAIVRNMAEDFKSVKTVVEQYKMDRVKLIALCSASIALGAALGKYLK